MSLTLDRYPLETKLVVQHRAGCDGKQLTAYFVIDSGLVSLGCECPKCGQVPVIAVDVQGHLLTAGPLAANFQVSRAEATGDQRARPLILGATRRK